MFCPKCGASNNEGASFCVTCGNNLKTTETIENSTPVENNPQMNIQPEPMVQPVNNDNNNNNFNNNTNNNSNDIADLISTKITGAIDKINSKVSPNGFLGKNGKYIGLGGCLLAIIGCFLPWATFLGQSVHLYEGNDGKVLILCVVISAALIFLKKGKESLISSLIAIVIFVIDMYNLFDLGYGFSVGLITILVGICGMCAYPFIGKE